MVELHTADVPTMQRAAEVLSTLGAGEPSTDPATRRCSIAAPGGAKLLPVGGAGAGRGRGGGGGHRVAATDVRRGVPGVDRAHDPHLTHRDERDGGRQRQRRWTSTSPQEDAA